MERKVIEIITKIVITILLAFLCVTLSNYISSKYRTHTTYERKGLEVISLKIERRVQKFSIAFIARDQFGDARFILYSPEKHGEEIEKSINKALCLNLIVHEATVLSDNTQHNEYYLNKIEPTEKCKK